MLVAYAYHEWGELTHLSVCAEGVKPSHPWNEMFTLVTEGGIPSHVYVTHEFGEWGEANEITGIHLEKPVPYSGELSCVIVKKAVN